MEVIKWKLYAEGVRLNGGIPNSHIAPFDFDQRGYGFRAFEIAKFNASIHSLKTKHLVAEAFVDGYQQVHRRGQAKMDVIAHFETASVVRVMAIHAYNADRIGRKWLKLLFLDRRVAMLKEVDNAATDS
jgi:Ser/Thr protein kinase RdoA (MazF antagonist)